MIDPGGQNGGFVSLSLSRRIAALREATIAIENVLGCDR